MEEKLVNEFETEENVNIEEIEVTEDFNDKDWNLGLLAFAGIVGATALVGGILYKSRGKIDELRIKRLEKRGYSVTKMIDATSESAEESDELSEESEDEE